MVVIVAVFSALIGAGATVGLAYLTFASKDQELKVHLVEIAIGILRANPKEDVTPARGWALDIIEKNSGVPFSQEDREALLHKPLTSWKTEGGFADWLEEMKKEGFAEKWKMMPGKQMPDAGSNPPNASQKGNHSGSPLVHCPASVMDRERAHLRAVSHKRREQIGELGVPTIVPLESLYVVPLAPSARLTDNRENRGADIGEVSAPSRGMGGAYRRTNRERKDPDVDLRWSSSSRL